MYMIDAIIVDDEPYCCTVLATLLKKYCPHVQIQASCTSAEEGIQAIQTFHPGLVFLDIEMPGMSGFQMLEHLNQIDFNLIITTSYDRYALKAFSFSAIDYLLKPIDRNDLIKAVEKSLTKPVVQLRRQLEILLEKIGTTAAAPSRIAISTMDSLEMINLDQIISCTSESNYTLIKLKNNKTFTVSKTLKEVEEMLPMHNFLRVHHSYLVNLNEISRYVKGDGGYLIMADGSKVEVSRTRKESVIKRLTQPK